MAYQYISSVVTPDKTNVSKDGRGPIDVEISAGVQLASLSASVVSLSSTFVGNSWTVVLPATDVSKYSNVAVTLVNNHATNKLESGSVEFSPNNANWETDWDVTTFAGLAAAGGINSLQISGNSRKYLRVRVIPSGATGAFTGSVDAYLTVNNG